MSENERETSLSQIETRWSLVFRAHRTDGDVTATAQRELMERYAEAIHRYLLRVAGDPHVAADLGQEFALKFLNGEFQGADPRRGRFRNYVKAAILNLVTDARRRRKHDPKPLPDDGAQLTSPDQDVVELDRQFLDCWRDEVLERAWEALDRHEEESEQPFYTLLRFRVDNPALRSHEMAERLTGVLGKTVSAVWVRQNLRRARKKFVQFVQEEVSRSLDNPTIEERDEEMRALGLWAYCHPERD
jgi:RNA polymerase sigma factor (sigma-70 family)